MTLLFPLKSLNESRAVLLLSMHKVCMTLINVEINFETAARFLTLLKTSNQYFEISNGYLVSKQGFTLLGISF